MTLEWWATGSSFGFRSLSTQSHRDSNKPGLMA